MNPSRVVIGCVQVTPGDDMQINIDRISEAVGIAASQGARLIATPEYSFFLHASGRAMRESACEESAHPALAHFSQLARALRLWLLLGSVVVKTPDGNIVNRSIVIDDRGEIASRYDKIHMFDATLPDGRAIRESSTYTPGSEAVVVASPWGRLGLSICYDLRFPGLYRMLALAGARMLFVPSAFTKATGSVHWHALVKARAIENRAYVIAPATCGTHPGGHQTYGHAIIVDPDGRELASAGDAPDVICAEIDLDIVTMARERIPSLIHERPFELNVVDTISGRQPA